MASNEVLEVEIAHIKEDVQELKSDVREIKSMLTGMQATRGWMPTSFKEWVTFIAVVLYLVTGIGADVVGQLIGDGWAAPQIEQVAKP